MIIRQGSLTEVVAIVANIDEFVNKESEASLSARLNGKPHYIQIAEHEGRLLGFKIGYQIDQCTFYSWFGGVAPQARGKGVAQALLVAQEQWARDHHYQSITVKSRNQFPAMLRLLIKNNYLIENYEKKDNMLESRIYFRKTLFSEQN